MSLEFLKSISERLVDWIQNYVSPVPKKLVDAGDELKALPGSDRQLVWVPKRQTLKHTVFTMPEQLKGRKRNTALDLKIRAWAPFETVGYSVLWQNNQASVFAWDQDAIEERIRAHGYHPSRCEVVPEAFIREPMDNGIRLMEVSDGVEGQVWEDNFLTVARWWKSAPDGQEWTLFRRSAGIAFEGSEAERNISSDPKWLEIPWNTAFRSKNFLGQFLMNQALVTALVTILLTPCMYFTGAWITYGILNRGLSASISEIEASGKSVRTERSRAISALEYAESLSSLRRYPRQIEIISRAHSLLVPFSIQVSGWDYDEGILEFGLKSESDMNATLYIPTFENDPMFSRVSASTRGTRLVMRMNVSLMKDAEL